MAQQIGMDPGVIRGIADQIVAASGEVQQIAHSVDDVVRLMGTLWLGEDCDQLSYAWRLVHRSSLGLLVDQLHTLAQSARTNATEQDQASAGGIGGAPHVGWAASRPSGSGTLDFLGPGLAAAGIGITLTQLSQLGSRLGIATREWEPGVLNMLDDGGPLSKAGRVLGFVGIAMDGAKLGKDVAEGANPWAWGYDVAGTAVDGVGVFVPEVALVKGAWDVGVWSGQEIAQIPAVNHALNTSNDRALDVGASHVQGDVHTDPTAAADLVKRYSGPTGVLHWGEDSVAGLFHH